MMGTVCTIRIDFLSGQQLKNPRHQTLGLVNIAEISHSPHINVFKRQLFEIRGQTFADL